MECISPSELAASWSSLKIFSSAPWLMIPVNTSQFQNEPPRKGPVEKKTFPKTLNDINAISNPIGICARIFLILYFVYFTYQNIVFRFPLKSCRFEAVLAIINLVGHGKGGFLLSNITEGPSFTVADCFSNSNQIFSGITSNFLEKRIPPPWPENG